MKKAQHPETKIGDRFFGKEDFVQALAHYRAAADAGDEDAAKNIAYLLLQCDAVKDTEEAHRFLEKMSRAGRAWATTQLVDIRAGLEIARLRAERVKLTDAEKIDQLSVRFDLGGHRDRILAVSRPSVLLLARGADDDPSAVGKTRLGGAPDLRADSSWPTRGKRPLSFLGQVNLKTMQSVVRDGALPATGLLAFFYDIKEQPWGSPDERGAWAILFEPDLTALVRRKPPPKVKSLSPVSIHASRELTLPFSRTALARSLDLSEDEFARYRSLYDAHQTEYCLTPASDGDVHRFLGHPDAIQGDMTRRIEYALRDMDVDAEDAAAEAAARTWRFLFQVGSESPWDMWGGDKGRLFFFLREEDLAARRFEAAFLQLQAH